MVQEAMPLLSWPEPSACPVQLVFRMQTAFAGRMPSWYHSQKALSPVSAFSEPELFPFEFKRVWSMLILKTSPSHNPQRQGPVPTSQISRILDSKA